MKNAYICCTPFHVINSTHLALNKKGEKNHIYICDHFNGSKEIYENFKKVDVFDEVYYVKDKKINYDRSFLKSKKISSFIKGEILTDNVVDNLEYDYNHLFIFSFSYFTNVLCDRAKSLNTNVVISLVEEGIMTYMYQKSGKEKIKNYLDSGLRIFNKRILNYNLIDELLLFKPDLYVGDHKNVNKIPQYNNKKLSAILNQVFDYKSQEDFGKISSIFFDQLLELDENKKRKILNILDLFIDLNLLIKIHPRDDINKYNLKELVVNNAPYPWELIYMNENPEKSVLLAISSTAVLNPKLLFNKDHEIILLYKLLGIENKTYEKFINNFKNISSKNIYEPNSSKELFTILERYK